MKVLKACVSLSASLLLLSACTQKSDNKNSSSKKSAQSTADASPTSKVLYSLSDGVCTLYTFSAAVPEDREAGLLIGSSCPETSKIGGKSAKRLKGCSAFKTEDGTKIQHFFYDQFKRDASSPVEKLEESAVSEMCKSYKSIILDGSSGGSESSIEVSAPSEDTSDNEQTKTITLEDGACILRTYQNSFTPDPLSNEKIGSECPASLDVGSEKAKILNSCSAFKVDESDVVVTIYDKVSLGGSIVQPVISSQLQERCAEIKEMLTAP